MQLDIGGCGVKRRPKFDTPSKSVLASKALISLANILTHRLPRVDAIVEASEPDRETLISSGFRLESLLI